MSLEASTKKSRFIALLCYLLLYDDRGYLISKMFNKAVREKVGKGRYSKVGSLGQYRVYGYLNTLYSLGLLHTYEDMKGKLERYRNVVNVQYLVKQLGYSITEPDGKLLEGYLLLVSPFALRNDESRLRVCGLLIEWQMQRLEREGQLDEFSCLLFVELLLRDLRSILEEYEITYNKEGVTIRKNGKKSYERYLLLPHPSSDEILKVENELRNADIAHLFSAKQRRRTRLDFLNVEILSRFIEDFNNRTKLRMFNEYRPKEIPMEYSKPDFKLSRILRSAD